MYFQSDYMNVNVQLLYAKYLIDEYICRYTFNDVWIIIFIYYQAYSLSISIGFIQFWKRFWLMFIRCVIHIHFNLDYFITAFLQCIFHQVFISVYYFMILWAFHWTYVLFLFIFEHQECNICTESFIFFKYYDKILPCDVLM